MKIYHVTTKRTSEIAAIQEARPPRLLLSYFYFKKTRLEDFVKRLGYMPEIMLDSGAWSSYNSGHSVDLEDYLKYIQANRLYIAYYFSLDVIFDGERSFLAWQSMREKGFDPIPVFHYKEDEKYLKKYIGHSKIIGLGGTVPEPNKRKVAEWVRLLCWEYPEIDFHLLGSSSRKIIDSCDLSSVDSSTWIMQAINGRPGHIKGRDQESKIKRAVHNLRNEMKISR